MVVLPCLSDVSICHGNARSAICYGRRETRFAVLLVTLMLLVCGSWDLAFAQTQPATSTALVVTSGTGPVTTVTSGTVVTLTATVTSGSALVTVGQVNFCDASANYCTDIHVIGTAQLTSHGTAAVSFQPGPGSHHYKAVFAPTNKFQGSTSVTEALTVTGGAPTTTTLQAGSPDSEKYSLTATVNGTGGTVPTGTVSFSVFGNADVLGTAALTAGPSGVNFLTLPNSPATGDRSNNIAVADFNGDGMPDLAVVNQGPLASTTGSIAIFLGSGNGNFKPVAVSAATDQTPIAIVSADFNGDGIPDLAVANGGSNTVTILMGKGDGTFTSMPTAPATGEGPNAMTAADFNGDGIPDIAVLNGTGNSITILLGNGDGTFTPAAANQQTGSAPYFIATADFNGDGIADLALLNNNNGTDTLTIYLGNGDGSFTPVTTGPGTGTTAAAIAIGDFNGDDVPDIATVNSVVGGMAFPMSTATVTVSVLQGKGDGTFQAGSTLSFQSATGAPADAMLVADFNSDGNADLAVDLLSGDGLKVPSVVTVLLGDGSGNFKTTGISPNTGYPPAPLVAGDFNGDGVPDLAALSQEPTVANFPGVLDILLSVNQTATATATGISLPPAVGTESVIATYAGDSNFETSTSNAVTLTAPPGVPTVTVTAYSNPANYGDAIPLTANVSGSGPTPTGTVTFYDSSAQLAASQLQSGVATYTTPTSFSVGSHSIVVQYAGDANYSPGTSPVLVLVVRKANPTVTVTPSASTILFTQPLSVSVSVSGVAGNPIPQGSVVLSGGPVNLIAPVYTSASVTLVNGKATFNIPAESLGTGQVQLNVNYTPNATSAGLYSNFGGVSSILITGTTVPGMTVTPSSYAITNQQSVSVTVDVVGELPVGPTGTITLASGSYTEQMSLPYNQLKSTFEATFNIPAGTLSTGSNTLTASYSGDGEYEAETGTTTVTVSPLVVAVAAPSPVAPGANATATVTLATGTSYSGTLNLACSLTTSPANAQSLPTCSLNPATLAVGTGTSKTTTLTVKTTAASTALMHPLGIDLRRMGEGGLALAGVFMFGTAFRRRRWMSWMILFLIVSSVAVVGCGGGGVGGSGAGGGNSNPPPPSTAATTAGSYVFTVTATDSANASIASSSTVTVTVQ